MAKGNGSDSADNRWTVRGVPVGYRERVTERAERLDRSVGEVLCQAIDLQEQAEREPVDISPAGEQGGYVPSWAEVERRVTAAAAFAAATGKPMRRDVRRIGYDLLRQQFDGMKPALAKRVPPKAIAKAVAGPVLSGDATD